MKDKQIHCGQSVLADIKGHLLSPNIVSPLQSRHIPGLHKRIKEHNICRDYSKKTSHFLVVTSCAPLPPFSYDPGSASRVENECGTFFLSFLLQAGKRGEHCCRKRRALHLSVDTMSPLHGCRHNAGC